MISSSGGEGVSSAKVGSPLANSGSNLFVIPILEVIWRAVRVNLQIIAIIIGVCLIVGVVLTLLTTPQYAATARIEINRQQDNVTNVEGVRSEELGSDLEFYQTQYALLTARSLATRVVNSLNLLTSDDFFDKFGGSIDQDLSLSSTGRGGLSSADRAQRLRQATGILQSNISVEPVRGSSLVDITFTSPDPALSANIANTWVAQFIESNLDRRFSSTADARKFLQDQLVDLRQKLEESERNLVGYASNKEIVTLSSSQGQDGRTTSRRTMVESDLEALNQALSEATAARIGAQSGAQQQGRPTKDMLSNAAVNGLRQKKAEISSERAKLLTQFESGYPQVVALTSQIDELDSSIKREEARINSGATTAYREALAREQRLSQKVAELKQRFVSQNRDTIQYNIYQRDVDTNRQLYDGLLQRYKEIGVAGVGQNNVAIVDSAEIPVRPSSPLLGLNLALALLAGIGISAAFVFIREQIDLSLKNPSDVKDVLNLALLGCVPNVEDEDILESLNDKKSALSESYFSIGTNLSFLTDHGIPRAFMWTSTRANEGKTTSAFSMAKTLASTGKTVLLIDGDMRNPSLHTYLGLGNEMGFSNYLAGNDNLDQLISASQNPNLFIMFAGPIPASPSELLSSGRAKMLIEKLQMNYDHIIVDAPPVLGLADVPLLAGAVEGIVYTIEANGAKLHTIKTALQRILSANGNVYGAVVTKLDSRNVLYDYGAVYGYGYGKSDDET